MAHPKRTRSNVNGGKKQAAAKQASNKKKKTFLKCNDELRSFLDSQAQSLHSLSTVCPVFFSTFHFVFILQFRCMIMQKYFLKNPHKTCQSHCIIWMIWPQHFAIFDWQSRALENIVDCAFKACRVKVCRYVFILETSFMVFLSQILVPHIIQCHPRY